MATSSMTMPSTDAVNQYIDYCNASKGNDRRVLGTVSTFLHDDPEGVKAELSLSAGRTAGAHCERISPDPKDTGKIKGGEDWKKFFSKCAEKLEPNTPYYIILHGDGNNGDKVPHGHVFFPWRFIDLRTYQKASDEAVRRQTAIDAVCKEFGLSVVEREPGTYNRAENRTPLSSVRATEAGRYSWLSDLKSRIDTARAKTSTREEFEGLLKLQGVEARFRGSGVSYSFKDNTGKQRIIRGRRLGTKYMLSRDSWKTPPPGDGGHGTGRRPDFTTGRSSRPTTGGIGGNAGRVSIDKSYLDEVSRMQAQAGEASMNQAIQEQTEAVRELANQLSRPGR